jgi:GNAT superfamily N-acetyltransferase
VLIDKGLEGAACFGQFTELLDIIVRGQHQGKGLGRALLGHAEAVSVDAGAYCMYVRTYAGSRDALTFYIRHGFVPVAIHPDVHGPDDDGSVYLRKILKPRNADQVATIDG